jgi:holo-[acyl-carrier protein] synthase
MILGIGTDIVGIDRVDSAVRRNEDLILRLFIKENSTENPASIAGKFAAKEALFKALPNKSFNVWEESQIKKDPFGKPFFEFTGELESYMEGLIIHLSISHDAGIAIATVVIER